MGKSVNRVTLLGNLGQDPEMRSTASGKSVCTLNIATSKRYKNQSGEWQESTDWHKVVLWERLADIAGQYLQKGSKVYIEGRLQTRSYEAKDGGTRYVTEVVATELVMLSSREQSGDSGYGQKDYQSQQGPSGNLAQDDAMDDEVPF